MRTQQVITEAEVLKALADIVAEWHDDPAMKNLIAGARCLAMNLILNAPTRLPEACERLVDAAIESGKNRCQPSTPQT